MSDRIGFDNIIGLQTAKRPLLKGLTNNSPAHAYLFVGAEGTGKNTVALEFAKALNCESPEENQACGKCASCHSIDHGNFPDIRIWSPDGQNTKIEQMQEMRDLSNFAPVRGKWQVNIIEQGDTLNESSANCILKLLEEPPSYLINIILYRNIANVLATIRSRCQLIRFTQVNADELKIRLVEDFNVDEDHAKFLAAYSQGCPGKAISLIGDENFRSKRDEIISLTSELVSGKRWSALRLAENLRKPSGIKQTSKSEQEDDEDDSESNTQSDQPKSRKKVKDTVVESLDILAIWFRDLLAAKVQGSNAVLVNVDKQEEIKRQASKFPKTEQILNSIIKINIAKRNILSNANTQITTESLVMQIGL